MFILVSPINITNSQDVASNLLREGEIEGTAGADNLNGRDLALAFVSRKQAEIVADLGKSYREEFKKSDDDQTKIITG